MADIPVYLIAGFLDGGKTDFINGILEDGFAREDKTLLICCEEGELEYEQKALDNVTVVPGGDYMVSYATFPAYFLKDDQNVAHFQAALDATLFKEQIAAPLNITRRYVGSEPFSPTTDIYNQELTRVLPPEVEVKILDRAANASQDVISATKVRAAIANDELAVVQDYVPQTTLSFIQNHWSDLRARIKEGSLE